MAEFTLYIGNRNYSSWSLRAWLPLKEAGFAFDEAMIPLREPGSADEIRRQSPAGKLPVLRHGSLLVWDSLAIGEYLAELAPALVPADRAARAAMRCAVAEMHSGFVPLRSHLPMNMRAARPDRGVTPEVQADIDRITSLWRELRGRFGQGGPFLFGRFSLADAAYAPVVSRFRTYAVPLDALCQDYADAVRSLRSMQDWEAAAARETAVIAVNEV